MDDEEKKIKLLELKRDNCKVRLQYMQAVCISSAFTIVVLFFSLVIGSGIPFDRSFLNFFPIFAIVVLALILILVIRTYILYFIKPESDAYKKAHNELKKYLKQTKKLKKETNKK